MFRGKQIFAIWVELQNNISVSIILTKFKFLHSLGVFKKYIRAFCIQSKLITCEKKKRISEVTCVRNWAKAFVLFQRRRKRGTFVMCFSFCINAHWTKKWMQIVNNKYMLANAQTISFKILFKACDFFNVKGLIPSEKLCYWIVQKTLVKFDIFFYLCVQ